MSNHVLCHYNIVTGIDNRLMKFWSRNWLIGLFDFEIRFNLLLIFGFRKPKIWSFWSRLTNNVMFWFEWKREYLWFEIWLTKPWFWFNVTVVITKSRCWYIACNWCSLVRNFGSRLNERSEIVLENSIDNGWIDDFGVWFDICSIVAEFLGLRFEGFLDDYWFWVDD